MLLSKTWELYESDKRIEGFSPQTFEFMFSSGCRIGEIVSLDKNCINWSNSSAIVLGKGNKEREVYFNIRCEIWLKRYLDLRQEFCLKVLGDYSPTIPSLSLSRI